MRWGWRTGTIEYEETCLFGVVTFRTSFSEDQVKQFVAMEVRHERSFYNAIRMSWLQASNFCTKPRGVVAATEANVCM